MDGLTKLCFENQNWPHTFGFRFEKFWQVWILVRKEMRRCALKTVTTFSAAINDLEITCLIVSKTSLYVMMG